MNQSDEFRLTKNCIMENIETNQLFFFGLIAFILNLAIMYSIIQSATKAKENNKLLKKQVDILEQIALKNGVEQETLNNISELHK